MHVSAGHVPYVTYLRRPLSTALACLFVGLVVQTPLFVAVESGSGQVALYLVTKGANLEVRHTAQRHDGVLRTVAMRRPTDCNDNRNTHIGAWAWRGVHSFLE